MAQSVIPKMRGDDTSAGDVFSSLHREIDRVFDEFTRGQWPFPFSGSGSGKLSPNVNVSETDKKIEITAELPGVEEKDIDVSLSDDKLTIKAEKKSETEQTDKDYFLAERSYGVFERTMTLPCEVSDKKVKAAFKNGVLTITLPKSSKVKTRKKKIKVQSH